MSDLKISALPAASALAGSELVPVVQGGTTAKASVASLGVGITSVGALTALTVNGNVTVDTDTLFVDSATDRVGIGINTPAKTLHVDGEMYVGPSTPSNDGTLVVNRQKTLSSGAWRAFRDESTFTGTGGGQAYACFDAGAFLGGSANYDHIVGFQSRPTHASSGTLNDLSGVATILVNNGGACTNAWGLRVYDTTGTGTVTNQYGLRVNALTKGANNWAVFTEGTAPSSFGGSIGIGTTAPDSILHMRSASTLNWKLENTGANGATVASFAGVGAGSFGAISNHPVFFYTNNAERMRVKATGQVRFVPLSADPSGQETGDVYYNSTTNKLRVYNGTAWVDLH